MLQTLQACRALAALLVVMFHAGGTLAKEKYFGTHASVPELLASFAGGGWVAFFFVLSGFVIHRVHAHEMGRPERLGNFLVRRALRIYPLFWVVFFTVYGLAWAIPGLRSGLPSDPMVILKAALLWRQDPAQVGSLGAPVLYVAWSLHYEVVFYLAFALAFVDKRLFYAAVALCGAAAMAELLLPAGAFPFTLFESHLFLLFGMGMLADRAVQRSAWRVQRPLLLAAVTTLALIGATALQNWILDERSRHLVDLCYGAGCAVLVFALTRFESSRPPAALAGLLVPLSRSAYAVYLVHAPLVAVLSRILAAVLPRNDVGAGCAYGLVIVLCLAAGVVLHYTIERPLVGWLRRALVGGRALGQPA